MKSPYGAVVAAVGTALQYVAPTLRSEESRSSHDPPPRYVWWSPKFQPSKRRTTTINGGDEPTLCEGEFTAFVDCWGGTEDDAWSMAVALMQATRDVLCGGNYSLSNADLEEPRPYTLGHVYTMQLSLFLLIPEVDIATVAAGINSATGYADAAAQVTPVAYDTVETPWTWEFDSSDGVGGDGKLTAGEG